MKQVYAVLLLLLIHSSASPAVVRWDGTAGDGNWATAANWSGDVVPGAGDDVVLDNSILAGSYSVNLPSGNSSVSVNSLIITPSGTAIITLVNPVTNTSPTAFTATGPGDAVVLNDRAVFRNSSGASSGTPVGVTTTNFFRINNGGRYVHNCDRGHTTTLVARLSSAPGTEQGNFEFDVPVAGFTFSFSGRVFGNLEFSSAARGSVVAYASVGSLLSTINGNLIVNTGVNLSLDYTSEILIKGSLQQSVGSSINLSNGSGNTRYRIRGMLQSAGFLTETGSGLPELYLDGSAAQSVDVTGSIANSITLTINNSAGVNLLSPLVLPYQLQLVNGVVQTTPAAVLTLVDNAICTGASSASFVNGPVKKIGDEAFQFPIGEGTEFAPLSISGGGNSSDSWIARYFRGNPQQQFGPVYESPPVRHMSALEWWDLERAVGVSQPTVTLSVRGYSDATLTSALLVLRWDGAFWKNEGRSASTGIAVGFVTSNPVTGFAAPGLSTHFTLGSEAPFPANPLPVTGIGISAYRDHPSTLSLEGALLGDPADSGWLVLQRMGYDGRFVSLDSQQTKSSQRAYHFHDRSLPPGRILYRLLLRQPAGGCLYSRVIEEEGWGAAPLCRIVNGPYPTKPSLKTWLPVSKLLDVKIFNLDGELLCRTVLSPGAGSAISQLPVQLPAGSYVLEVVMENKRIFSGRIMMF